MHQKSDSLTWLRLHVGDEEIEEVCALPWSIIVLLIDREKFNVLSNALSPYCLERTRILHPVWGINVDD